MSLKLLFFAQAADWVKTRQMEIPASLPKKLSDVIRDTPALSPLLPKIASLRVAVNCEFSEFTSEVKDGDEVAFIPPISGG